MEKKFLSKTGLITLKDILDNRFQKKFEFVESLPDVSTADPSVVYVVKVMSSKDSVSALKGYIIIDSSWNLLFDSSAISNTKELLTTDEFNTVIEQIYSSIDESKEATKGLKETLKEFAYAEVGEREDVPEGTEPVQLYQTEESDNKYPYVDLSEYSTKEGLDAVKQTADYAKEKIDNLKIGGVNLLPNTQTLDGWIALNKTENGYDNFTTSEYDATNIDTDYVNFLERTGIVFEPDTVYTLSYFAKGTRVYTFCHPKVNAQILANNTGATLNNDDDTRQYVNLTDKWERYYVTFRTLSTVAGDKRVLFRAIKGYRAAVCGVKLEKGNIATVWTPAPMDNIFLGTRNLLLRSNVELSSENYRIGEYYYAVKPEVGKIYTLTLCYKCGERTTQIEASAYGGALYESVSFTSKIKTVESKVFTLENHGTLPSAINFYNIPYNGSNVGGYNDDTVIYWATLVEGNYAPINYFAAPEDVALGIGNTTQGTDISKVSVTHRLCVIDTNSGGTFNLASTMLDGQELHVIVNNTSDYSIVIAIPTSFKTDIDSLEIEPKSFGEINVICQGDNKYLRAIS